MAQTRSITNGQIQSASFVALILSVFGTCWTIGAVSSFNGAGGSVPFIIVALICAIFIVFCLRLRIAARKLPKDNTISVFQQQRRPYAIINILMVIAIVIAIILCNSFNHTELVLPLIVFIVGLHFFALGIFFKGTTFYLAGALFCAIALIAIFFVPVTATLGGLTIEAKVLVICVLCGLLVWSSAIVSYVRGTQGLAQHRTNAVRVEA